MRIASFAPQSFAARLLVALVIAASSVTGGRAQAPATPALLLPAAASARVPAAVFVRPGTVQARAAQTNLTALAASTFDIEVAPGVTLRAELDRRDDHRNGAQTWAGHVAGEPLSTVTIVVQDGVVQGSIRTLGGAWLIEPAPGNTFAIVRQVDADAIGGDVEPVMPAPLLPPPTAGDAPIAAGDDGSTFDILVFYNEAARTNAGGDTAAQTRIALGVSETNTAYANSGITPRLRLVGAELLSYTESGDLGVDLDRLQATGDGIIDTVHARRDQLGADLVMLVVGDVAGGACGVGYVMTGLSSGMAAYAFTVTAYDCISPNYTFAHELGHNMGSAHAPEDGSGQPSLYPYSFGYKNPSNLFRTVMAYNCAGGCTRVLHFSNPNVSYNANTTGTAVQHDNARSINNAASTIANWRQTAGGGGNTAPTISAIGSVSTNEDTATPAIAFTIGDAQTAASSLTVTAASNTTALVPNTGGALALGGAGANRTLVVTPAANQFGTATITVTVSDGALTASRSFTLTVASVNDPPAIAAITAKTTAEDTPLGVTVNVSDVDSTLGSLTLQAVSSNAALVPAASVVFSGSGATRTATITPAADAVGAATLTFTVSDGAAATATSFTLTVTGADDAPGFDGATPLSVSTIVDTPVSFPVTITDPDTAGASLSLSGTTTNAAVLASSGISIVPTGATATSRTFTVTLTPVSGASGGGGVTLSASDGTNQTPRSVALSITVTAGPPDPPVALTATVSGTALQLAWLPAPTGSAPASYEVTVGTAPGTTTLPPQTTTATSLGITVPAGATYYARVRAVNTYGTSLPSAEATVTITV
ncbi:MAG: cadherin-like domain-containing protein, partial [Acidobacteria bacterium]|nr:cadherin-like domain-containing protein [Acidobacteriota bacterium]